MSEPAALDAGLLRAFPLPDLSEDGDKEERGRALVIAGSRELPGAAILAGTAALRAGAGKLRIVTEGGVAAVIGAAVPEARVMTDMDAIVGQVEEAGSVTLGCGLVDGPELDRLLGDLLDCGARVPLVLDAAALGCLAGVEDKVRAWRGGVALLPHVGEMARLLECEAEEVKRDPLAAARRAADRYHAAALVKGPHSFVAAPDGRAFRFEGGGVGLATSGSGDVLAGLVGGLAARGADVLTATLWGVWLHGEAGRILTGTVGRVGFLAREIADLVPGLLDAA